jgi:hypothetical protein
MPNNLNITTSNYGRNSDLFFLYDPALYVDFHDGNGFLSLGYLEAEKTWRQTVEYAVFKTGIPKSEVRRDVIDQTFEIEATLKQLQPETIALVTQRKYDDTDENFNRVIIGSDVPSPVFPSCVLIGQNVNARELRLYIRRLQITSEDFEVILGGDDYSSVPFKGTAQIDETPLITNPTWPYNPAEATNDNIAFWAWAKEGTSSGDLSF